MWEQSAGIRELNQEKVVTTNACTILEDVNIRMLQVLDNGLLALGLRGLKSMVNRFKWQNGIPIRKACPPISKGQTKSVKMEEFRNFVQRQKMLSHF